MHIVVEYSGGCGLPDFIGGMLCGGLTREKEFVCFCLSPHSSFLCWVAFLSEIVCLLRPVGLSVTLGVFVFFTRPWTWTWSVWKLCFFSFIVCCMSVLCAWCLQCTLLLYLGALFLRWTQCTSHCKHVSGRWAVYQWLNVDWTLKAFASHLI